MVLRVLVTGGTGLVGKALQDVLESATEENRNEEWFFVGSNEADLT